MSLSQKLTIIGCFAITFCQAQSGEGIHLHFDKDIYLPGETIWFKAYVYNSTASAISTNFYTAIYDENGKLLQQKLYPIIEGTCNGDFTIADTIAANKIQFIAYTKAMVLTDSNNIFKKILSVYKKEAGLQTNVAIEKNINLQFFPEGGNLVARVNNFIAFKAWYADGSPAQVSGKIQDEETHTVIDSFSTNKQGLGKFQINPEQKTYTALWKGEDGKIVKTELPAVNPSGIVLHTELLKNELYYIINKNSQDDHLKILHLLAQKNNEELYKADLLIGDKNSLVSKFPIDSLPSGIIQLTLFDNNWNPLQERIVFINTSINKKALINEIEKDRSAKAKNTIELLIPDTLLTNLSASIADINFYNKTGSNSIKQSLWFNTQLKGLNSNINEEIESGNAAAIDLIMLTHGWRKYSWKNVINKQPEEPKAVDNYLSLDINYKEKNYALPKDEILSLIINDKATGKQFYNLNPASQTAFSQAGIVFYDSAKIYYRVKKNNDLLSNLSVSKNEDLKMPAATAPLKQHSVQNLLTVSEAKNWVDTFAAPRFKKFNDIKTIKEIIVKGKYVNPITKRMLQLDEKYSSGLFSGITRGYQLNVLDDEKAWGASDIYSYIKYNIPSKLGIAGLPGNRKLYPCTMTGNDTCDPIVVFINENESTGDMLESIPLSTVAYIKYTPGIVINSSLYTSNGALYVYTKKGDEESPGSNSMKSIYLKGYDMPKEFFNPDYTDKASLLQPDLRTTLYWNPYIITDKNNNKVKIEYYNNDISKRLLLTIEGVNEEGELIHIEKIIE